MLSVSCINIVSKIINPDSIKEPTDTPKEIPISTDTPTINLVQNFKLPIQYLDNSQLFSITDNVSNDLELITTENEKQKSMYHYLFKPTNNFAENLIPEWKKYYTTNVEYLNELCTYANKLGLYYKNYNDLSTNIASKSNDDVIDVVFRTSISNNERKQLLTAATSLLYTPENEHFGIVPVEGKKLILNNILIFIIKFNIC